MPHPRRLARAIVVLALAAPMAVALGAVTPAAATVAGALSPADGGTLFGAYVNFDGIKTFEGRQAQVLEMESDLGRTLDIDHHYLAWGDSLADPIVQWDVAGGRTPLISWHGSKASSIIDGSQDDLIRWQAGEVKSLGAEVFIRYGWEMDGSRNGWWVESPSKFKASWRHIHDLFAQEGVTNAVWVWCPEAWAFRVGRAAQYYPGSSYVDWIGADGYSWAGKGESWHSFKWIFDPFYGWAKKKDKPLMVAEFGARRGRKDQRGDWLRAMSRTVRKDFTRIQAVVYFDSHARYDWRPHTETSAYDAFVSVANQPHFVHGG